MTCLLSFDLNKNENGGNMLSKAGHWTLKNETINREIANDYLPTDVSKWIECSE